MVTLQREAREGRSWLMQSARLSLVALASQPFEGEGSDSEFGLQLSEGSAISCLLAGFPTF